MLKKPHDEDSQTQRAFWRCLFLLHGKLKNTKPWEISEEFIADLGAEVYGVPYAEQLSTVVMPLSYDNDDGR